MSFTTEEVTRAIEKLVRSSVRRPYDSLGTRRLDVPFSDTQEAAAGVFLLDPKAPFYVLSIGAARLLRTLRLEADLVGQVIDAIGARGRLALPVTSISPLHNARAALDELGGAVTGRAHGFTSVERVPAYQRFKNNVDRFLRDAGSNVKLNGELVQTPQQAKKNLPGLLRELRAVHDELQEKVGLLKNGMDNYGKVNLPSLVAQGVISRARDLLAGHAAELEGMSPDQRNETLRQVVLDLCTSKAVVKQFGSLVTPTSVLTVNGIGSLFSDVDHPAVPASAICSAPGPYDIVTGRNVVDLFVDVPFPFEPKYSGTSSNILPISGGAIITAIGADFVAANVTPGDVVYVSTGTNRYARWIVSVVNTSQLQVASTTTALSDVASDFLVCRAPTQSITLANSFVAEVKGTIDQDYDIQVGVNQVLVLRTIDTTQTLTETVTIPDGVYDADAAAFWINTGLMGSGMNLQAGAFFNLLKFQSNVTIASLGGNNARFTLLSGNTSSRNLKVGDQVVISSGANSGKIYTVTSLGMTTVDGVGTSAVSADASALVEMGTQRRVRLYAPDPAQALALRETILVVDDDAAAGARETFGFFAGIYSTSRPSTAKDVAADINGKTTLVSASVVRDEFQLVNAATDPLRPTTLVLHTEPVLSYGMVLTVPSGPNAGDYYVESQDGVDVIVAPKIPLVALNGQPVSMSGISISSEHVQITSLDRTVASYIFVREPHALLTLTRWAEGFMRTPWFLLPETPRRLDAGDRLELYRSTYDLPTVTHDIIEVLRAMNLLQVEPPITPELLSYSFSEIVVPPFARLRAGKVIDFEGFKGRLDTWHRSTTNTGEFFRELTRLVNPLLANDHPMASAVNDARNKTIELAEILTVAGATLGGADPELALENILGGYVVDPVPSVDTLLRTYAQQGAERAVDLLVEGRFSAFFAMSVDQASYTGDVLHKMRAVQRTDLPVSKIDRADTSESQPVGGVEDTDFEYDTSDAEDVVVDPPEV